MRTIFNEIIGRDERIISYSSPEDALIKRIVINSIELSTGRKRIERAYEQLKVLDDQNADIWNAVFPLLSINLEYNRIGLEQTPSEGPLVVIANHPFGVADGLALGHVLSRFRKDFSLIVNSVMCREKILGKYFLPVDFAETKTAMRCNLNTRRKSLEILRSGGAIGIFPSGGVSTTPKWWKRTAEDLEWKNFLIKLVRTEGVRVLPIFFYGQNSTSFQLASHIHSNIRLALLLNELDKMKRKTLQFYIGQLISQEELSSIPRTELLPFLKARTLSLKND